MSDDVTIYDLKCFIVVSQEGSESRAAIKGGENRKRVEVLGAA